MTLSSVAVPVLLCAVLGLAPPSQPTHEHKAPHGGALVELGEEFAHLEFVLDSTKGTLTAYVLDGEAEQAVRVTAPSIDVTVTPKQGAAVSLQLRAVESPLTGETLGDTSQFATMSPKLARVTRFEGVVNVVTVRGREFRRVAFRYPEGSEH
jgi:hypothetical protein